MRENWKAFIAKKYLEYKEIQPTPCTALHDQLVVFNRHGFRHIISKSNSPREKEEVKRRLELLKYATVVTSKGIITDKRETRGLRSVAYWWELIRQIDGLTVHVVVRQIGTGQKHFFSIF